MEVTDAMEKLQTFINREVSVVAAEFHDNVMAIGGMIFIYERFLSISLYI